MLGLLPSSNQSLLQVPGSIHSRQRMGGRDRGHTAVVNNQPEDPCQLVVCIALLVIVEVCVKGCEGTWRVVWMAAPLKLGENH